MKTIRLDGVVGVDIFADDVARQLAGETEVELVLNSGGGHILEGFSIFNVINDFKGFTRSKIDYAGSMMSVIAMATTERVMKKNSSMMMTHRPWGSLMVSGNSENLREQVGIHAKTLDKMEVMVTNLYSEVSGMSFDEAKSYLSEERYLTADEALEFGLIDQVEDGKADLSLVAMAGMRSHSAVGFDMSKFCAKIDDIAANKPPVKNLFASASTLAEVEKIARNNLKLSRAEVTAIVAAVKNVVHCDNEPSEKVDLTEMFKNFKIGENHDRTKSGSTSGL